MIRLVFTLQGVMSGAIPWKMLEKKFFEVEEYREIGEDLVSPEQVFWMLTNLHNRISIEINTFIM